jgi:hypothetical protein
LCLLLFFDDFDFIKLFLFCKVVIDESFEPFLLGHFDLGPVGIEFERELMNFGFERVISLNVIFEMAGWLVIPK